MLTYAAGAAVRVRLARPAMGGFAGATGRWAHSGKYWEDVVEYLRTTWPFWDASGGTDHVFVMMGDHGACEAPRKKGIPQVLTPAILVSHWGNTFNTSDMGPSPDDWPYYDMGPCYRPHHDIVIPPPQQHDLTQSPLMTIGGSAEGYVA